MNQEKRHGLRQARVASLLTFVIAVPVAYFLSPLMNSSADSGYPWRIGLLVAVINGVVTYWKWKQNDKKRGQ